MREREQFPPALCRAARGLLGWSIDQLAGEAALEGEAIELFEASAGELAESELAKIGRAFGRAGVIAIRERLAGAGVRWARPASAPLFGSGEDHHGEAGNAFDEDDEDSRLEARWRCLIAPIPAHAPDPFDPCAGGPPQRAPFWTYRNHAGAALFYVVRFENPDGSLRCFMPRTLWAEASSRPHWEWAPHRPPRPLYGLHKLAARPGAPVLILLGEAAADDAAALRPQLVAMTWQGGRKGMAKADWAALAGRRVAISPAVDDCSGRRMSPPLARHLAAAGADLIEYGDAERSGLDV
jgi:hypothetical protein